MEPLSVSQQEMHGLLHENERWFSSINKKKIVVLVLLSVAVVVSLLCSNSTQEQSSSNILQLNANLRLAYSSRALQELNTYRPADVLIIGHRGCKTRFPENSLAAIAACSEEGAHIAEIDLVLTKDRHVVLFHDEYWVEQKTNREHWKMSKTPIHDLTLQQVQSDYWLAPNFQSGYTPAPLRIPTFEEALRVAKGCGIVLWIELKLGETITMVDLLRPVVKILNKQQAWDLVVFNCGDTTKADEFLQTLQNELQQSSKEEELPFVRMLGDGRTLNKVLIKAKTSINGPGAVDGSYANKLLPHQHLFNIKFPEKTNSTIMCDTLRQEHEVGTMISLLWTAGGEHLLRDPNKVREYTDKYHVDDILLQPCPYTVRLDRPCFELQLIHPIVTKTCARMLTTDLPQAVRAALLHEQRAAPASIWPIEKSSTNSLPRCLIQTPGIEQAVDDGI